MQAVDVGASRAHAGCWPDLLAHGPVLDAVCGQLGLLSSGWGALNALRGPCKVRGHPGLCPAHGVAYEAG
jgi:hypothetical protein